jgi:hypothetical protein
MLKLPITIKQNLLKSIGFLLFLLFLGLGNALILIVAYSAYGLSINSIIPLMTTLLLIPLIINFTLNLVKEKIISSEAMTIIFYFKKPRTLFFKSLERIVLTDNSHSVRFLKNALLFKFQINQTKSTIVIPKKDLSFDVNELLQFFKDKVENPHVKG